LFSKFSPKYNRLRYAVQALPLEFIMTDAVISSPPASGTLRLALAQLDFPVGDITGNRDRIIQTIQRARDEFHANIVVFPELALSGPLPGDLLLRDEFIEACGQAMQKITESTRGIIAIVGWPEKDHNHKIIKNSLGVLCNCSIHKIIHKKMESPLYFYNKNYFNRGEHEENYIFEVNDGLYVNLISDADALSYKAYMDKHYFDIALIVDNSFFFLGKNNVINSILEDSTYKFGGGMVWLNTIGSQDGVVFDGGSLFINYHSRKNVYDELDFNLKIPPSSTLFEEHLLVLDYDDDECSFTPLYWPVDQDRSEEALIWKAITRGIADYCRKNGFDKVWLGLSGGIDSALVLALAVDALGAENVRAVSLPSRHTVSLSNDLAAEQCQTLGVKLDTIPIEPAYQGFLQTLSGLFEGLPENVAEENLQSRCRGTILMALTNKFGGLLLSTGNKSEYAVGYATIYGDMCGGYAPLKDLYKTQVYKLCRWRNNAHVGEAVIPLRVIERAPSAELRDNQRDQDSLPPYEVLDDILYKYMELQQSKQAIIKDGHDAETVTRVLHLLRSSEWKRHQGPPGPKLSRCAFGHDWRYPISNGWRD